MDVFFSFISLVLLSAGLGIDNGLLIEFSLKGLNLDEKKHLVWRSVALVMAALLRIGFLFSLSQLSFLENPMPRSNWFPNLWFAPEGVELTWMSLVLFAGGLIILAMAVWEYYHKFREELEGHSHTGKVSKSGTFKVLAVVGYLALMNVLFSLDSVFAAVAIMDLETQFWWMVAAILIVLIGVTIGALAGFYGGWIDNILMRFTELFQVLPALLFSMVVVALFEPKPRTISIAIGVVLWPQLARLTRAEFLRLKNLEFVKAARAIGSSDFRIMWRVIFPNALPPLIVATTLVMGGAILFEAGLAFLGLGDPNHVSWGLMIGLNRANFLTSWWTVTFPGMAIFVTVLSFSLIGDGLQDAFNPKLRGR